MENKAKKIVILGAGYCGIKVAMKLAGRAAREGLEIYIVDRQSKHVYISDLYEIASAYYPERGQQCMNVLGNILGFPFKSVIFKNPALHFIQADVTRVDHREQKVEFKNHPDLSYDFLVLTLGSQTNYFGLQPCPNLYPLKTLGESLQLNCDLDHFFQSHQLDHKKVSIIIGGGGFTGIELACELPGFLKKLSQKYHFERTQVQLLVIQGGKELIGLGEKVHRIVAKRLDRLGIKFMLGAAIKSFDSKTVVTEDRNSNKNEHFPADFLIWTAGVKPNEVLHNSFQKLTAHGELVASPTLEAADYPNIFVGGDNALIVNPKTNQFLPKLGQLAIQQGELIAKNLLLKIQGRSQQNYQPFFKGFILTLGGKDALYCGKITFSGLIPWLMRKFIDLYYYLSILPFLTAVNKWWRMEKVISLKD